MADTPELLPKSREYFRNYLKAKKQDIFDSMREYNVGYGRPYGEFYRSNEVVDCIRSIYHNLEETFGHLNIPEEFASPKQLVQTWKWFYDYLVSLDELFNDIYTAIEKKIKKEHPDDYEQLIKAGFMYPPPLTAIDEIRQEVKNLLEHILEMDEVTEILDKINGNTKEVKVQNSEKEKTEGVVEFNLRKDSFDIAIITALYDTEFEAVLNLPIAFTPFGSDNDPTDYYHGLIGNKKVLIATDHSMGMASAAALSTKIIAKFSPKYLFMAGIAGGVKKQGRNLGDILVARTTWNYDSGKYSYSEEEQKTTFEPDPEQIPLSPKMVTLINSVKKNVIILTDIFVSYTPTIDNLKPTNIPQVIIGPLASGSSVLSDKNKIEDIKLGARKLIGIDMETYGVFYSAERFSEKKQTIPISIKSISDFADDEKDDKYRDYAAHTSARFIYHFILNKLQ